MEEPATRPELPLLAVVGPTASGKSKLGVALSQRFDGEVVCCDSTQLYRGFDVGTAKVREAERGGVAHHLVDLVEPHEVFTAGAYRNAALKVLEDLERRSKLPVFTVGTGLYLRALLEGLADAPTRSEELRARLRALAEERGHAHLHRVLERLDREAAARIAPRDTPKIIRAIEICVLSGKRVTEIYRSARPGLAGWRAIKLGLAPPRKELYARIEERTQAMLRAGWLEEVRRLLDAGVAPASKAFQFIGYKELRSHLLGVVPLEAAASAVQQATRRYAKRQLTWFRKEPGVHWLEGFGDDPQVTAAAAARVEEELGRGRAAGAW